MEKVCLEPLFFEFLSTSPLSLSPVHESTQKKNHLDLTLSQNAHFYLFKEKFLAWINYWWSYVDHCFFRNTFYSNQAFFVVAFCRLQWQIVKIEWDRLYARAFCPKTLHSTRKCITLTSQRFWHHKALTSIKKSKMSFKKILKTLEILEKPEAIFNRRLNSNPFHPFKKVGKNSKYLTNIISEPQPDA